MQALHKSYRASLKILVSRYLKSCVRLFSVWVFLSSGLSSNLAPNRQSRRYIPISVNINRLSLVNVFLFLRCYNWAMKNYISALGFTLVELLVTISVAAILLSVAVPSYTSLIGSSHSSDAVKKLAASFSHARSEAVTRGENITVCASTDFAVCSGDTQWETGWIVLSAANVVLRVESSLPTSVDFVGDVSSTCFNRLGNLCVPATESYTARANGESAALTVESSGLVRF